MLETLLSYLDSYGISHYEIKHKDQAGFTDEIIVKTNIRLLFMLDYIEGCYIGIVCYNINNKDNVHTRYFYIDEDNIDSVCLKIITMIQVCNSIDNGIS